MKTENEPVTVPDYVESLIAALASCGAIEPSTRCRYAYAARHIRAAFGDTPLGELTPRAARAWEAAMLASGQSAASVSKAHRLLRQAMADAVLCGCAESNPMDLVKPPKKRPVKGKNALGAQGRARMLEALRSEEPCRVSAAALTALYTGLRVGEVCGLKWGDVDWEAGVLWVRRSVGRDGGAVYVKETKTGRVRDVALPDGLAAELRRWRAVCPKGPFVIGGERAARPDTVARQWSQKAARLGLIGEDGRPATMHALRHTWATMAVAAGVDIKTVASNLGHANAAMTLNTYASADPDAKRRCAEVVGALLG